MRILMCMLAATLAVGCNKKTVPPGAQPGSGSGSGSGSAVQAEKPAAESGSAATSNAIVLPRLEGEELTKPPHQTTKPVAQATYEKLAKDFTYLGFKQSVKVINDSTVEVQYLTETRPKLAIVVKLWHCEGSRGDLACEAPTLDVWLPKKLALTQDLKGGLAEDLTTVVDIGQVDLGGGAKGIYTYQLGYNLGKDRQGAGAYANVYKLHWNDGINRISVTSEYRDDPAASMKDMMMLAPQADLAKLAKAFFNVYTHAWE